MPGYIVTRFTWPDRQGLLSCFSRRLQRSHPPGRSALPATHTGVDLGHELDPGDAQSGTVPTPYQSFHREILQRAVYHE